MVCHGEDNNRRCAVLAWKERGLVADKGGRHWPPLLYVHLERVASSIASRHDPLHDCGYHRLGICL